ncbi:MAG: hypothetical protein AAF982_02605 [Pseudomonadota bacterium]
MSDLLASLTPRERRGLENLSERTGVAVEDLACEMVAAYLRLVLDAPRVPAGKKLVAAIRKRSRV